MFIILFLSGNSCYRSSKSANPGNHKSDEKDAQKLKKIEREEKEFRRKFKVSFVQINLVHIRYKD